MLRPGSTGSFLSVWFYEGLSYSFCCWCASLLCWVLPQCLCILVLIQWFRGQILRAEMFLVGVRWFLVHEMFLVWIVPSFVCFLRYTKIWVRDTRNSVFCYYETFGFSSFDECCEYGGSLFWELELLLRLQVT